MRRLATIGLVASSATADDLLVIPAKTLKKFGTAEGAKSSAAPVEEGKGLAMVGKHLESTARQISEGKGRTVVSRGNNNDIEMDP